jgi:alpha-L-rhamnosidase
MLNPHTLRCEYLSDSLGIDILQPRLSWQLSSAQRGQAQSAYRMLVANSPDYLASHQGDLWDSGRVASRQTCHIPYAGVPVTSGQRCYRQVQIWDQEGSRFA